MADITDLNPQLKSRLSAATAALTKAGIDYSVTSGFRSREKQAELYANRDSNTNPVAKPGTSAHEKGNAVDIVIKPSQRQQGVQILQDHGLVNTVPNDPVHFTLARAAGGNPPVLPPVGGINPKLTSGVKLGNLDPNNPDHEGQLRRALGLPVEKVLDYREDEGQVQPVGLTRETRERINAPYGIPPEANKPPTLPGSPFVNQVTALPAAGAPSALPTPTPTAAPQPTPQQTSLAATSAGLTPAQIVSGTNPSPTNPITSALAPGGPSLSQASDPLTTQTQRISQTATGPLKQAITDYSIKTGGRDYVKDLVIRYAAAPSAAKEDILREADTYGLRPTVQTLGQVFAGGMPTLSSSPAATSSDSTFGGLGGGIGNLLTNLSQGPR